MAIGMSAMAIVTTGSRWRVAMRAPTLSRADPLRTLRAHVDDAPNDDHREDAHRAADDRDGDRAMLGESEACGEHVHHRDRDEPGAGGRKRHRWRERLRTRRQN